MFFSSLGFFRFFPKLPSFSSSGVAQNVSGCSGLTDLCTENVGFGEPSGCRDRISGDSAECKKSLGKKGTI